MTKDPVELLTLDELAKMLRKSPAYVYANQARLGIPRYRLGQTYRYDVAQVLAWLGENAA